MPAIHRERHPQPVDGCDNCRWLSIAVAPSATPSRNGGADAAATNARESRWQTDMPAYKQLREQGLHPRSIDGAHQLTGASDAFEVEAGHVFRTAKERAEARAGMEAARELKQDMADAS